LIALEDPKLLLDIATKAAIQAGNYLRDQRTDALKVINYKAKDTKINGDKQAEKIILSYLKKYTTFPILSEETGLSGTLNVDSVFWVVDPLDGTVNYSEGIPFCCVSIALMNSQQPHLGVIYDFIQDEIFTGIVGKGAWLNNLPISTSKISSIKDAILATGFPVDTDFSDEILFPFVKQIQTYKKVRLLGSAALSLAYVASGRMDVYLENDIMLWDVAAGCAIVIGAGGVVDIEISSFQAPVIVKAACSEQLQY